LAGLLCRPANPKYVKIDPVEGSYNLLVIEDDSAVARSLKDGLERSGFHVTWKASGEEGVQFASSQKPHLVVLDVRLPDGSGFDFCRKMRLLGLHMPVLILTVQSEEVDKVLGLEMGADDYVTKAFSLRELVSRLRALLRRAYGEFSNTDSDLLYAGDLVIDQTRALVQRGDLLINLTPTEFRLLVYLARHPGQVVTRTQIIEALWGYASDLESERTVNVHVRPLREKVELDPSRPAMILTVPGIGYRLVPWPSAGQ
jgi:DNA-binding response OmpR family regulator